MDSIKKIYISGLGAVGSLYSSLIYKMDPDSIKVIADKDRIKRYNEHGIVINNEIYNFEYLTPQDIAPPADLIIITVKQHHLEQSIRDIKNFVGENTIILSLLNGISSEDIIGAEFGMEKILYSFCVGIDAVRVHNVTKFTTTGRIVFGEKNNHKYSSKVIAVKELFDRVNINYTIPEDMIRELWWKFMVNVGINQLSAILKAPYGVFQKFDETQQLLKTVFLEVIALANKLGINLCENDIDKFIKVLNTLSPEGKTSMLQDIEAGRKTEVEIFAGTVLELGRKHGIDTPVNNMLFNLIRTLEQM